LVPEDIHTVLVDGEHVVDDVPVDELGTGRHGEGSSVDPSLVEVN
jgi:hypothetical protein